MTTTLCGIRHHGPGSARAVLGALEEVRPDVVLVEGPPEGQDLVATLARDDLVLPVALMLYSAKDPERGSFYPVVEYSPELVAVRWAARNRVPVQLVDAPYGVTTGMEHQHGEGDPLGTVARLCGYEDAEVWWEDTFEAASHQPLEVFDVLQELMGTLRASAEEARPASDLDRLREAHMRLALAGAEKEHTNVLAVVGAWHLPALTTRAVTKDRGVVRELSGTKERLSAAVVPWSDRRLSTASGYGAGVPSPGWYSHLWAGGEHLVERWVTRTATLLRANGISASTASTIETVRLASMLATVRERHTPNLEDLLEATQAVLTHGRREPLELVLSELVVGHRVGALPDDVPQVPLAVDLARLQRALRLPVTTRGSVALDLREPNGLARSHLLHRLGVLGVHWGSLEGSSGRGTFKEVWTLAWEPELSLELAVKAHLGNTVESAANAQLVQDAQGADLRRAAELVDSALLAELPVALEAALLALDRAAAESGDAATLLSALEPVGQALRYGSARGHAPARLEEVFSSLLVRAAVMLPPASRGLNADASAELGPTLASAHAAVEIHASPHNQDVWHRALVEVSRVGAPRLSGWATRALLDLSLIGEEEARALVDRYLTKVPPADGMLWLEGLLTGSAALLLRDRRLWDVLDTWLCGLPDEEFEDNVPLLRRTFSEYTPAERRALGERVGGGVTGTEVELDLDRALPALRAALRVLEVARG